MQWVDVFYGPVPALIVSGTLLALAAALSWQGTGRRIVLAICLLLLTRYMVWRGLYTLNADDGLSLAISLGLYLAEVYGFVQFLFFAYQAWDPTDRTPPPITTHPSVDIMVPVVGEPIHILRRTLIGCMAQQYPSDRLRVYVLDDGPREEVRGLAEELGVVYLSRQDREHAKAGNLNHALAHSSGELVVVFDVDHVPARNFLERTVGFFADERVAIVQTAQHFYNQDIYQRALAPRRRLHNEQALFFRTLQSGRDRHNSAFFAGSSGVLRRTALEEIGGFRTETITEDLHTSLLLHAKGYQSCYLNEALASGLMPETFEGHLKQRKRWATGAAQVLVRDNPLFKRGLTWPQRLDYLGSIHYFFLGLPRIVYLIAPLSWLLLSVPALKADPLALIHFFFSTYLASNLGIRMVSRNTRNAFWSDVHESATCFALAGAACKGLLTRSWQRFEVTPKGQRSERSGVTSAAAIGWHAAAFALLILGICYGLVQWSSAAPPPGLSISLGWAGFNVLLLTAVIFAARERPQVRGLMRLARDYPCYVLTGSGEVEAVTLDLDEAGIAVRIARPVHALQKDVRVALPIEEDELLTLKGTIVRQEPEDGGQATLGIRFVELDRRTSEALIRKAFSSSEVFRDEAIAGADMWGSFWSLLTASVRLRDRLRPSRRRMLRMELQKPCSLRVDGSLLSGSTRESSFAGLSAVFPGSHELHAQACALSIEDVELIVSPVASVRRRGETLMRFRVESITRGERQWHAWHQPSA